MSGKSLRVTLDDVHSWTVRCRAVAESTSEELRRHDTAAQSCDRGFSENSTAAFLSFGTYLDHRRKALTAIVDSLSTRLDQSARAIVATETRNATSIRATSAPGPAPRLNTD